MTHHEASLLTLTDWQHAYRDGASPRELLTARLQRLHEGAMPGVWIARVDAAALEARLIELDAWAAASDRAALLNRYPLFGVPFAVKDNIDVAGMDTTAACPAWARRADRSATVVHRLLAAGAVLVGKSNMDQFATGLVGTRSPYGAPASVFAADRVSGGSSSGSAVAVARGEVVFALGTDTAGSGRVPAAFNNLVGLKPTPGRVSTAGVLPACRSIDCVSVLARTVADAATVLALIEGADEADEYSGYAPGSGRMPDKPRIGVPAMPQLDESLGYRAAWSAALERLEAIGAQIVPVDFQPLHEVAALLYQGPWVAERYAVVQSLIESDPAAMEPTVRRVIEQAKSYSAVDGFRGQYALRRHRAQAAAIWRDVDVLMVPSTPGHPTFAEVEADPIGANAALGTYTNFVNLLGWSALALPAGFTTERLPFGVTFIAPGGADAALARWGQRWQAETAEPLRWPASVATLKLAVVGAHLSGFPLNGQLLERGAHLVEATHTAPKYRLYELPNSQPPKPGLLRVPDGGAAIALEVWEMPQAAIGSFLALIPPPLGLGSIELVSGRHVHGFLCESAALAGARDISHHGGWRAYLASR